MVRTRSKRQYPKAFLDMVEAAKFPSVHALGKEIGSTDALRNYLRGRTRVLRTDTLQALAKALDRSMEDVAEALGMPQRARSQLPGEPSATTAVRAPVRAGAALPVRHAVQAGAWLEVDETAQARIPSPPVTADPAFPREAQWLELVRGDAVDLYYPDGSFVHVVDAVAIGYAPRHEDFVVVERKRHQGGLIERSLKQIAITEGVVELWPRSRNPNWKAPLDLYSEADEETTIEIAALVLGGYVPARR